MEKTMEWTRKHDATIMAKVFGAVVTEIKNGPKPDYVYTLLDSYRRSVPEYDQDFVSVIAALKHWRAQDPGKRDWKVSTWAVEGVSDAYMFRGFVSQESDACPYTHVALSPEAALAGAFYQALTGEVWK